MSNVLITGCSSGFGLLAALEFARRGDTVFATMRDTSKDGDLKAAAAKENLKVNVLKLDLLDQASIDSAIAEAQRSGPIDVLVNNAGFEVRSSIEDASEDEIRRQFETNVFGTVRVMKAVLPDMRKRGAGVIINLSSVAGVVGVPFGGYYAASKHALEAITETMHYEVRPFGVRVALVEPGAFQTSFGANIVVAKDFNERSPYWNTSERFHAARTKLSNPEAPNDPMDVAKAIVEAAYTDTPRLRWLVGGDAQLIGAVRKQTDFEGFEAAMRQTLDWWD
jgi:NAD(P)-dependent dehydrogenase (short-subunit alcohol dehydrogenase family)